MNRLNTARLAGLSYLGLAVSGALGYLVIRGQLFDPDNALVTAANLVEHQTLARVGVVADLAIVSFQCLAALYFFKLFRRVDSLSAGALAAFGFMGAASIMAATIFSATAIRGAENDSTGLSPQALYELSESAWDVGGIFFGLWLIPMGFLVLRTINMPRPLGWILVTGGFGYLLSTAVTFLASDTGVIPDALVAPATIGEVWMIAYLLFMSVAPVAAAPEQTSPREEVGARSGTIARPKDIVALPALEARLRDSE